MISEETRIQEFEIRMDRITFSHRLTNNKHSSRIIKKFDTTNTECV
jgi:hypothetical protein